MCVCVGENRLNLRSTYLTLSAFKQPLLITAVSALFSSPYGLLTAVYIGLSLWSTPIMTWHLLVSMRATPLPSGNPTTNSNTQVINLSRYIRLHNIHAYGVFIALFSAKRHLARDFHVFIITHMARCLVTVGVIWVRPNGSPNNAPHNMRIHFVLYVDMGVLSHQSEHWTTATLATTNWDSHPISSYICLHMHIHVCRRVFRHRDIYACSLGRVFVWDALHSI